MKIAKDQLLIIIDPQKDFTSTGGVYATRHSGIQQILETKQGINRLLNLVPADQVVLVCSDYQEEQFGKGISMCIPGTEGHEIDIEFKDTHTLFYKTAHSCFSSPAFCQYLKNNPIERLILSGFLAEYCVKQTAIDGLALGYQVSVLTDLIATGDDVQKRKENTLSELKIKGAEMIKGLNV